MKIPVLCLAATALASAGGRIAMAQPISTPPATGVQAAKPVGGPAKPAGKSAAATAGTGAVEEVVVTAERRTTNLQKTPIAATVLSQKDLLANGVTTVDQLQFVAPSVTVNSFGQGDDFDIRGIGKGEHNTQTGTGVVTYRDGVPAFPGYFTEEPFYDISNIEVLRGPQGTFSGQNATGGAVIINTRDPVIGGAYDGYVLGHIGNYADTGFQGAVNLPISDTFAARVALNLERRDPFYNISGPLQGNRDLNWASGRIALLWQPNPNLKVSLKSDFDDLDSGGYFGDQLTNPDTHNLFKFANNYTTYADDHFVRTTLKVDYTLPDEIVLRSVSGYQQGRTAWKGDIDGTDLPAPNFIIAEAVDERIWSQEFNIISPEKRLVTWILGGFFQENNYTFPTNNFDIGVPPGVVDEDLQGKNPTHNLAGFGQVSLNLPDGFQLQGGLRYSLWETKNAAQFYVPEFGLNYPVVQSEKGNNVTGKITLNWNVDSRNFLYAFVATGSKPGGLNEPLYFGGGILPAPFRQEYVTDYEVGWKSRLLDDHLRTQIGAYYNNFSHFQVIIPIPNNPLQVTEENNPSATKLYGFEASAQAVFGDFTGNGNIGIENSSLGTIYSEDPRNAITGTCNLSSGPGVGACRNLSGQQQTYAPNLTFNLGAQYDFHVSDTDVISPRINFAHVSHQWATLFENVAAGDYLAPRNILGASLAYTHGSITASLYGYNLTDDHYVTAALPPIRLAGAPRQFGFSLLKTF